MRELAAELVRRIIQNAVRPFRNLFKGKTYGFVNISPLCHRFRSFDQRWEVLGETLFLWLDSCHLPIPSDCCLEGESGVAMDGGCLPSKNSANLINIHSLLWFFNKRLVLRHEYILFHRILLFRLVLLVRNDLTLYRREMVATLKRHLLRAVLPIELWQLFYLQLEKKFFLA